MEQLCNTKLKLNLYSVGVRKSQLRLKASLTLEFVY
jgi:hypothetical protein